MGNGPDQSRIIKSGSQTIGEATSLPAPKDTENWTGALFAQSFLMQAHWALDTKHELKLPGKRRAYPLPFCRLDELGSLGYDARDIFDAFAVDRTAATWSPYPGFWNHDADQVRSIAQRPNATLLARTEALKNRKLKDAESVWSKAGKILLVSRLWPVTHRVVAIGLNKKTLGNTWWGFDDSKLTQDQRKALLLWLNSTLGILLYFGRRAITRSAWMQMKKPAWSAMPVIDVRQLSRVHLAELATTYDNVVKGELAPIAQLDKDGQRQEIDTAFCRVLGLPGLGAIRELLSREPGLTAADIGPASDEEEEDEPA